MTDDRRIGFTLLYGVVFRFGTDRVPNERLNGRADMIDGDGVFGVSNPEVEMEMWGCSTLRWCDDADVFPVVVSEVV